MVHVVYLIRMFAVTLARSSFLDYFFRMRIVLDADLNTQVSESVADPGCLSLILIYTHPGSKNINRREG
jgi:hypothetical protein